MMPTLPLFAAETITHRFARLTTMSQWWHWPLLALICLAITWYVIRTYRRDGVELPRPLPAVLMLLRLAAFLGILFFFFKLERRAERQLVKNSRVLLLVDTSQSMTLADVGGQSGTGMPRIDAVTDALKQGSLVDRLRDDHDVVVYRFDQSESPTETVAFPKKKSADVEDVSHLVAESTLNEARLLAQIAAGLAAVSLIAFIIQGVVGRFRAKSERTAWGTLIGMVSLIAAGVVFATATLRTPHLSLAAIVGAESPGEKIDDSDAATSSDAPGVDPREFDWKNALQAEGRETRLGDGLLALLRNERGGSAAGIVPITDGNRNAGIEVAAAIPVAIDAGIPIFPVAMGSDQAAVNVRVVDLEAPQRVYPGDKFVVVGHIQATGVRSGSLKLELLSAPADQNEKERVETLEQEKTIEFLDGELLVIKFEIEPQKDLADKREFRLRVKPLERETELADNQRSAKVEIVDRKDKVLLFAGGPTREFIFLRNQLYRDEENGSHVTVLLQSAKPGIAQESHAIITEFPQTEDELFAYDCIVAFDPDWEALDELQIKLLERWVGEQAGGLITVAGPIFTPQWSTRRDAGKLRTVKSLYPVVFYGTAASAGLNRFGSEKAWPLEFTPEGNEAAFLHLGEGTEASRKAWSSFDGVFGYYAVKDPKAGAHVYARFADPEAKLDDQFPIYMAGDFYGTGRVFYLGSGEMWRVRSIDESYFEEFYTKLIRWVSEGRLLRDSNRAVLMVDKDRCHIGDRVTVRAKVFDPLHKPLSAAEVVATLVPPRGRPVPFPLKKLRNAENEGLFTEQFTATMEGDYRIELAPASSEERTVTREVRVRLPDNELRDSKRNDAVLLDLAKRTGGAMFVGPDALRVSSAGGDGLVDRIEPKDQTTVVQGTPDKKFEQRLMGWLIGLIGGVLCLEWLLRRLNKLA